MKFKKKTALAGVVVFLGLLIAWPATRDELDWFWTQSRDQADDYLQYSHDWPKGRHFQEARLRYQQRTRSEIKRAEINEAMKKDAAAQADPVAHQERLARVERFLWKQVTNINTVDSYRDYLRRYPAGEFAGPAHARIQALYQQAANAAVNTNLPPR